MPHFLLDSVEIVKISNPSTAGILERAIGKGGAILMNVGVIISVLSCWLSWTLILSETPLLIANDKNFPKIFTRKNEKDVSSASALTSAIMTQLGLIVVYFSNDAYRVMVSMSAIMMLPAYFCSTFYLIKIALNKKNFKRLPLSRNNVLFFAIVSWLLSIAIMFFAGIKLLMGACVLYLIGTPIYIFSKKELKNKKPIFKIYEIFIIFVLIAITVLIFIF